MVTITLTGAGTPKKVVIRYCDPIQLKLGTGAVPFKNNYNGRCESIQRNDDKIAKIR